MVVNIFQYNADEKIELWYNQYHLIVSEWLNEEIKVILTNQPINDAYTAQDPVRMHAL